MEKTVLLNDVKEKARRVADLRDALAKAKESVAAIEQQIAETHPEYAGAKEHLRLAKQETEIAETTLRDYAGQAAKEGIVLPYGIKTRTETEVVYSDTALAFEWCAKYALCFLVMDTKTIESAVRAKLVRIPGIKTHELTKGLIPSNLEVD